MAELDSRFFEPFVEGTVMTLKIQCDLEAKPGKPFVKGEQAQPVFAIAGVIGITSTAFNGNIVLGFPERVFLGVMSKMLGEKFEEIGKELADGAAEILNIIFGQAKAILGTQGYTVQRAIPTVVMGSEIVTSTVTAGPVMVLPFEVEFGEFHIEIASESPS